MTSIYPKMFEALSRIEVDYIDRMLEQIKTQNLADNENLDRAYNQAIPESFESGNEYHSYKDSLTDDFNILKEVDSLALQLSIVALYRIVEVRTKSMLRKYITDPNADIEDAYKIKTLRTIIRNEFHFELEDIEYFNQIDSLRVLNNSIKHQELGPDNSVTQEMFSLYARIIPQYLYSLCWRFENS